jgi:2-oxoglutarate ferredoxin oxidoreductase subunit delta
MPPKGRIVVDDFFCKGCELCVEACPQGVLQLSSERINMKGYHPAEMLSIGCTGCGICAIICPEVAIMVYREVKTKEPAIPNPQEKE